jgi:hypothetical protein
MRYFFLLGLVILAACAPAQSPRLNRADIININVITDFVPDKGQGGTYRIGEQLKFTFQLARPGFITLLSYGATGNTQAAEKNLKLEAGKHSFPRANDRQGTAQAAYVLGAPTGNNRAILIYSNVALKTIPSGRLDITQLETSIKNTLAESKTDTADLAETNFEVTP